MLCIFWWIFSCLKKKTFLLLNGIVFSLENSYYVLFCHPNPCFSHFFCSPRVWHTHWISRDNDLTKGTKTSLCSNKTSLQTDELHSTMYLIYILLRGCGAVLEHEVQSLTCFVCAWLFHMTKETEKYVWKRNKQKSCWFGYMHKFSILHWNCLLLFTINPDDFFYRATNIYCYRLSYFLNVLDRENVSVWIFYFSRVEVKEVNWRDISLKCYIHFMKCGFFSPSERSYP